jgi:hypothetical protein
VELNKLLILLEKKMLEVIFNKLLEKIESIFKGQDCFASLTVGYIDNAMFVLEIVNITLSVLVFQGLKLETTSLWKL